MQRDNRLFLSVLDLYILSFKNMYTSSVLKLGINLKNIFYLITLYIFPCKN